MVGMLPAKTLRNEQFDLLPHEFVPRMTEYLFRLRIDKNDFTSRIHDHDGIGRRLQQAFELKFRALAIGNVTDRAHRETAFLRFQGAQADLHRGFGAVLALAIQFKPSTHRAPAGFSGEARSVSRMARA